MWISEEERKQHKAQEDAWAKVKDARRNRKKVRRRSLRRKKTKFQEENSARKRCEDYLSHFWEKFNLTRTGEEKMRLLQRAASPPWKRVSPAMRLHLRNKYQRHGWKLLDVPISECPVCGNTSASEKHHVIPLCFGGINENRNLLKICYGCHDAIHPWMKADV